MEGLDHHFSNGKLQYKMFVAGMGGATGWILPKTLISGSSVTWILFPLISDDVIFTFLCIICLDIVFAFSLPVP